jgi:hypothetical protein
MQMVYIVPAQCKRFVTSKPELLKNVVAIVSSKAKNTMSIVLSDAFTNQGNSGSMLDSFGSGRVVEKNNIFCLNSAYGISKYRDITSHIGNGRIEQQDAAICLVVDGGGDEIVLESQEHGVFQVSATVEVGICLEFDEEEFTGDQELEFGYFDGYNGMTYHYDKTNKLSVRLYEKGTMTEILQNSWNGDFHRDGGVNCIRGNIFVINIVWPHGCCLFSALYAEEGGLQVTRLLHSYSPLYGEVLLDPNLPIRCQLKANTTTGSCTVRVTGRQFSIIGKYYMDPRTSASFLTSTASEDFVYLASYKSTKKCQNDLAEIDIISTGTVHIRVYQKCTLADESFINIDNESSIVRDTAGTCSVTGDSFVVYECLSSGVRYLDEIKLHMFHDVPIHVFVKGASADMVCRFKECY